MRKKTQSARKPIKLIAPDGSEIVGMLATDGSTCSFACTHMFRGGEHHFFYELPKDSLDSLADISGDRVLIDANDKHWPAADVQYASTPRRA